MASPAVEHVHLHVRSIAADRLLLLFTVRGTAFPGVQGCLASGKLGGVAGYDAGWCSLSFVHNASKAAKNDSLVLPLVLQAGGQAVAYGQGPGQ